MFSKRRIKGYLKRKSLSNQTFIIILAVLLCLFMILFIYSIFPPRRIDYFPEGKNMEESSFDREWVEQEKERYREHWERLPEREKERIRKIYNEKI